MFKDGFFVLSLNGVIFIKASRLNGVIFNLTTGLDKIGHFREELLLETFSGAHCAKDFLIVKKIQPNLIPSKTIPIGCVDLNYKIKFAIRYFI